MSSFLEPGLGPMPESADPAAETVPEAVTDSGPDSEPEFVPRPRFTGAIRVVMIAPSRRCAPGWRRR